MLVKTDPMAAVDIYSRFPISDDPSFDDAFIFGEIVRLLMKSAEYDDSRLSPNLIAMGRVMGLGATYHTHTYTMLMLSCTCLSTGFLYLSLPHKT